MQVFITPLIQFLFLFCFSVFSFPSIITFSKNGSPVDAPRTPALQASSSIPENSPPHRVEPVMSFAFRNTPNGGHVIEHKIIHPSSAKSASSVKDLPTQTPQPARASSELKRNRKRDFAILTPTIWNDLMAQVTAKNPKLDSIDLAASKDTGLSTTNTQNGLTLGTLCTPMTVIFARGTLETGNVGKITGPPFFAALAAVMGNASIAIQGVDYPADIGGFLEGGSANGSSTMANLVKTAFSKCPSTKVVLSGYSQGAQLVHNAASQLSPSTLSALSSIVLFGDPDNGTAIVSGTTKLTTNVLTICHKADNICQGGNQVLTAHLNYAMDAGAAAAFVAMWSGLGMGVNMTVQGSVGMGIGS